VGVPLWSGTCTEGAGAAFKLSGMDKLIGWPSLVDERRSPSGWRFTAKRQRRRLRRANSSVPGWSRTS